MGVAARQVTTLAALLILALTAPVAMERSPFSVMPRPIAAEATIAEKPV